MSKAYEKINNLIYFMENNSSENFAPMLNMYKNRPEDFEEIVSKIKIFNIKKLNKNNFKNNQMYINSTEEKIELIRTNKESKKNTSSIEKLTFMKKNNFFNPVLAKYEHLSDNFKSSLIFKCESANLKEARMELISETLVTTNSKDKEIKLQKNHYTFKEQVFFKQKDSFGFESFGNTYKKEEIVKNFNITFAKYKKIILQSKKNFFKR